ncbi:MAG: aspartate-semialdehyde dehydrogenase [Myxococcota bacterium]
MRICILGATGLVGRESIDLCARAWPGAELALFASRDQVLEHGGRSWTVRGAPALEAPDAPRGDLALVALDDDHSARYVPRLRALGYRVVDKSNTYRLEPAVPLVVAGANHPQVAGATLVANPNCTTIPMVLALAPLAARFGLASITASTYQAVSGAGIAALDEFLDDARRGFAAPDRLGLAFEPNRYAGNTVAHHGKTDDTGFSAEERKLVQESRKILGRPALEVSAQCCRVGVAVGHYLNLWVTFDAPAPVDAIEEVLATAPFVRFYPGPTGEAISAAGCVRDRDRALVGRVRADPRDRSGRSVCLTAAADNLRLGAATNAVRVASVWFPSADPELQAVE